MLSGRNLRRRMQDALATASPLALAEAMDAQICSRSAADLREVIERSRKRMDAGERSQLDLYVKPGDGDDLLGHRFSAFLRQNPRAIASLDDDAIDAILRELGEVGHVDRSRRRLPAAVSGLLALLLAVAILPLAAQYAHQRGLLAGLTDPLLQPAVAPFVERIALARPKAPVRHAVHQGSAVRVHHIARRAQLRKRVVAVVPHAHVRAHVHTHPHVRRTFIADASTFGTRARLSVRSYLHALIAGNIPLALEHLGLPRGAGTNGLAELSIVAPGTSVAIVGSKALAAGEQVQAEIVTAGREYFEVFYVVKDGPAVRITNRYYIPVNRRAEVASRATRTE